ncbi:MAG: hypothetical protein QNJ68_14700 [Microcoleaceae cyanobacterium MO_207.B10]|nr:hypothetical protein [Microcoleaceae cyanobacterium MO_207.B10]
MKKYPVKLYIGIILGVLAAISVLAVIRSLSRAETKRYQTEYREKVRSQMLATKTRLEDATNSRLSLIQGLGAYISNVNPYIYREEFNTLAKLMVIQQSGVRGILYQDSDVDLFYPQTEGIATKPANLKSAIGRQGVATEAIKNKSIVLGGWMKWDEENEVLIALSPVFLKSNNKKDRYWGLAGILIDKNSLFQAAEITNNSENLQYVVQGENGEILFGDKEVLQEKPVILDVKLPNNLWKLAAVPESSWPKNSPIYSKLWMAGTVLALVIGGLVFGFFYLFTKDKNFGESNIQTGENIDTDIQTEENINTINTDEKSKVK